MGVRSAAARLRLELRGHPSGRGASSKLSRGVPRSCSAARGAPLTPMTRFAAIRLRMVRARARVSSTPSFRRWEASIDGRSIAVASHSDGARGPVAGSREPRGRGRRAVRDVPLPGERKRKTFASLSEHEPRAFNEPRGERALLPHAQTVAKGRSPFGRRRRCECFPGRGCGWKRPRRLASARAAWRGTSLSACARSGRPSSGPLRTVCPPRSRASARARRRCGPR